MFGNVFYKLISNLESKTFERSELDMRHAKCLFSYFFKIVLTTTNSLDDVRRWTV